jgi:hypothetical protein
MDNVGTMDGLECTQSLVDEVLWHWHQRAE